MKVPTNILPNDSEFTDEEEARDIQYKKLYIENIRRRKAGEPLLTEDDIEEI